MFFFLIGFARTRRAPWSWLAFGLALTAINAWKAPALQDTMVNILLNFALLRAIVLPPVEAYVMQRPLAVAAIVLVCLAGLRVTDAPLEYGTEGWLWAFAGLAHRLWWTGGDERMLRTRNALAAVAAAAYVIGERASDLMKKAWGSRSLGY